MILYKTYLKLFQENKISLGLSYRLPDYANKYWLEKLEKAILSVSSPLRFLDIGAGGGRFSILFLRTYFEQGIAIEKSPNKFIWNKIGQEFSSLRLIDDDAQKALTDLAGKKFDFILLSESFEHIPLVDVIPLIQSLKILLADGGCLFLTTPNFYVQGLAEDSPYWHEKLPYGHYKHYTFQEVKELFEENSFEVVWHCFESHWIKTNIYNNLFYPLSRLDNYFLEGFKHSPKIPNKLRDKLCFAYLYSTYPIAILCKAMIWLISKIIGMIEYYLNNESVSATLMILFRISSCEGQD
ncbi:MAG: class I SAM-dependent methyltransferase [Pseudanabaena sp.]